MVNLSSGVPLENTGVLECWKLGDQKFKCFTDECISGYKKSFHELIKKAKITLFKQASKPAKVYRNGKTAIVETNRNIIGRLLAISAKGGKIVDFQTALAYPLTSTPLSVSNPDGSHRVTQKSQLVKVLRSYQDNPNVQSNETDASIFVTDFIAQIRVLTKEVPETFEHLAIKILHSIPKGYLRVDIVADTYRASCIKTAEINKRGISSKIT